MAWDDWVFGVLTGGAYNVGKTVYKAGKAADQAGDAIEQIADEAGSALAIIATTFTELGHDLDSFLNELEELMTIKRVVPRNLDELWDEEVERYNGLKQKEQALIFELNSLGFTDEQCAELSKYSWMETLFGALTGGILSGDNEKNKKGRAICIKLSMVREAIKEILYEEPGVIPQSIYYFKEILERFNTLEQPRIEAIMDDAEDNLEKFHEIQEEVKKLFVIVKWVPVTISELGSDKIAELAMLEESKKNYANLLAKHVEIAKIVQASLLKMTPSEVVLPSTQIKKVQYPIASLTSSAVSILGAEEEKIGIAMAAPLASKTPAKIETAGKIVTGAFTQAWGKVQKQTMSQSISSALKDSTVTAYLGNHNLLLARIRFFEREHLKIEKKIWQIRWKKVEEPGVIPKILEEVRLSIEQFHNEEQPRVETLLDSLNSSIVRFNVEEQPKIEAIMTSMNETVVESRTMLVNINESIDKTQGWVDFIVSWRIPILIGIGLFATLCVAVMIALFVLLVKLAITL